MYGAPASKVWDDILQTLPITLTERVRHRVADKAKFHSMNYRDVAKATGLGHQTVMNFAKNSHRSTTDVIDTLAAWAGFP